MTRLGSLLPAIVLALAFWASPADAATIQCFAGDPAPCTVIGEFAWSRDDTFGDIFTVNNFSSDIFSGLQLSVEFTDASTDVASFFDDPLAAGGSTESIDTFFDVASALLSFTFRSTVFTVSLLASDLTEAPEGNFFGSTLVYAQVEAPEPSTVLLLALGFTAAGWRRWRAVGFRS